MKTKTLTPKKAAAAKARRGAAIATPTDLGAKATKDIATASLIENWIDETERRAWFLFESSRNADSGGH